MVACLGSLKQTYTKDFHAFNVKKCCFFEGRYIFAGLCDFMYLSPAHLLTYKTEIFYIIKKRM